MDGIAINYKEIEEWKTRNNNARSIIRSTLDDQVCDYESSADILKRIKSIYEPKTLNVLLKLLRKFFGYSWKSDNTVDTFIASLKS